MRAEFHVELPSHCIVPLKRIQHGALNILESKERATKQAKTEKNPAEADPGPRPDVCSVPGRSVDAVCGRDVCDSPAVRSTSGLSSPGSARLRQLRAAPRCRGIQPQQEQREGRAGGQQGWLGA